MQEKGSLEGRIPLKLPGGVSLTVRGSGQGVCVDGAVWLAYGEGQSCRGAETVERWS